MGDLVDLADWHDTEAQQAVDSGAEVWHSHAADDIRAHLCKIDHLAAENARLRAVVGRVRDVAEVRASQGPEVNMLALQALAALDSQGAAGED